MSKTSVAAANAPVIPLRARSWRVGSSRAVLRAVTQSRTNLVVWQRLVPYGIKRAIADWARTFPPSLEGQLCTRDAKVAALVATMEPPLRERIARDLQSLIDTFAKVTEAERVRVTFGVVRTDRCRKFHADFVRYRLITTYLGLGTEWLPEEAVDRAAMARSIECPFEANRAIVRADASVRRAVAGDVLLMKGAAHPGERGAVHRSPPLSAANPLRVLLTISTID